MKLRVLVGLCALVLASCAPDWARQNTSGMILRIEQIVATPGGAGSAGPILHSDVCCAITTDTAALTVALLRTNPTAPTTAVEDLTLTRYEVVYTRTDGHNVEGVDVPYRITGPLALNVTSPAASTVITTKITIDVVRAQAKLEPPLANLRKNSNFVLTGGSAAGGDIFITTIAHITIFGTTTNGHNLSASTDLEITFADWSGEG
jgi:hypothetical protein